MVLYQSIIFAVRHIPIMPKILTKNCVTKLALYSEITKCPSAESRIPRQNISKDCRPQRTKGFVRGERKNATSGDTIAATIASIAKKGMRRVRDKLFLLTGHN